MTTLTREIEQQAVEAAEGVGKVGTQVSLGIHHAVLAGGEPTRKLADTLHGTWLGHPLHPVLTDVVIGAWMLGAGFDAAGAITGSRSLERTADRLTEIGTIAAVPTALAGLADFSTFPEWSANTATWHAMLNTVNFGLYCLSIRDRRRGNRKRGVLLSSLAVGLTFVSAWLGGKLVYKQRVGVNNADRFEGPKEWTPVMSEFELPQHELKRAEFEGKGVLLWREGDAIYAIGSVCSHAGGPLEQGKVQGHCVQCPWHDSVFDLHDGRVVHGPATNPQPLFETRVRRGQIEIKLVEEEL